MLKKNKLIVVFLILLIIVSLYVVLTQKEATYSDKDKNFAIEDTASVVRIFLADKQGNTILLERNQDNSWQLNKKYTANKSVIQILLRTMMYITVRCPVAIPARDNVLKMMASNGIKVEIYQKKHLIDIGKIQLFERVKKTKVFYVGDNSQDNQGTYMKMANSDVPFVTYIPGFPGFLHTRFSTKLSDWRDHMVFNYLIKDIETITLEYPHEPEKSFRLENHNTQFKLFSLSKNEYVTDFDTTKIINYLSSFYNVRFEFLYDEVADKHLRDSLSKLTPFQILTLKTRDGKISKLETYLKPNPYTKEEMEARFLHPDTKWDPERMYAFINNRKDLVCIQYFVFGKILIPLHYFSKNYKEGGGQFIEITD